jgi:hypothetical protein
MQDARSSWPRTIRDTAGAVNIAETRTLTIGQCWFRVIKAHPAFVADTRRKLKQSCIRVRTARNMPSTRRRSRRCSAATTSRGSSA